MEEESAKIKLWLDYIGKLNDRALNRQRASGATTWVVLGVIAFLIEKVLTYLPKITANLNIAKLHLTSLTVVINCVLFSSFLLLFLMSFQDKSSSGVRHYFKLQGNDLKVFKNKVENFDLVKISKNTPHFMLWTERGTVRHAKMLGTEKAWDVQDQLEEFYFSKHPEQSQYGLTQLPEPKTKKALPGCLTEKSQDEIKQLIQSTAATLPREKQASYVISMWSALGTYFGVKKKPGDKTPAYKYIPEGARLECFSLIARLSIDHLVTMTNEQFEQTINERIKALPKPEAKEGELLSSEKPTSTILTEEDLAYLYCAWEETQKLITDLKPVLDLIGFSIPLVNVPNHLNNMQTAVTYLRGRFKSLMDAAAKKHGMFDRKHWKPVSEAGKLKENALTLHLSFNNPCQYERYLVTAHGGGTITVTPLAE